MYSALNLLRCAPTVPAQIPLESSHTINVMGTAAQLVKGKKTCNHKTDFLKYSEEAGIILQEKVTICQSRLRWPFLLV